MKKLILISFMLLFTSFKPNPKLTWLGTFDMYVDKSGTISVYYNGNIPQCVGKKVINFVYVDCDTIQLTVDDFKEKTVPLRRKTID